MNNTEQFRVTAEYLRSQGLSPTFPARFFAKIHFTEGCWLWTGAKSGNGYGGIGKAGHGSGMLGAHVASWILHFGPIPEETPLVLHDCPDGDKKSCVNPAHLWLGTSQDNATDAFLKEQIPWGERHHNAVLTDKQVLEILNYPKYWGSQKDISRLYGISKRTVCLIITRKAWRHIYG